MSLAPTSVVAAIALLIGAIAMARRRSRSGRIGAPSSPGSIQCDHCGRVLDVSVDAMISNEGEFLHRACALALGRDTRDSDDGADPDCTVCGLPIEERDDWVWAETTGRARTHASCADIVEG